MTDAVNLRLVNVKSELTRVKTLEDVRSLTSREEKVKEIRDVIADVHAVLRDRSKAENQLEWVMRTYPQLATVLTLLRTNPLVIGDERLLAIVLECILWFHTERPQSELQNKSNFWVQAQIRNMVFKSCEEELEEVRMTFDKFSENEEIAVQFLRRNYRLLDFITDEKICNGLHEKLLKHFVMFRDVRNESVVKEIWTKVKRNQLYLSPVSMKNLWLLHRVSLEVSILQVLRSENEEMHSLLINACATWPALARHSLRILQAMFTKTNYHPKSLLFGREIVASLTSSKVHNRIRNSILDQDSLWQSHLHPLSWLLSTDSPICDEDIIWESIRDDIRRKVLDRERVVWWLLLFPRWLENLVERLIRDDNVDALETVALLSHRSSGHCASAAELCHTASLTSTCDKCRSLAVSCFVKKMALRFGRKIDGEDLQRLVPRKNFETIVKYN